MKARNRKILGILGVICAATHAVRASDIEFVWNGSAATGDWLTNANWMGQNGGPGVAPDDIRAQIFLNFSGIPALRLTNTSQVSRIAFGGPTAFTVHIAPGAPGGQLHVNGNEYWPGSVGVVNNSAVTQNFVTDVNSSGQWGFMALHFDALAGSNVTYTNNGGSVSVVSGSVQGGVTAFYDHASGDHANFFNNPATGSGSMGGGTRFYNSSTAGGGSFNNIGGGSLDFGGTTYFYNNSTAASGHFFDDPGTAGAGYGGSTEFFDSATAGGAVFFTASPVVSGALPGRTIFHNTSNAGTGVFNNAGGGLSGGGTFFDAAVEFWDSASASSGTFMNFDGDANQAEGGATNFRNTATASAGTFSNMGSGSFGGLGGTTNFFDTATAGTGQFTASGGTTSGGNGGATRFYNSSVAGSATFIASGGTVNGAGGGRTLFYDTSTADGGTYTAIGATVAGGDAGATEFFNNATAGNGTFTTNGATASGAVGGATAFFNSSTAGNATLVTQPGSVAGALRGITEFVDTSTAGNATLTANGGTAPGISGGLTEFFISSTAGAATLIANAGTGGGTGAGIFFLAQSTGGTARVVTYGDGKLDISQHNAGTVSIGSLEGTGLAVLGNNTLNVGTNGLTTEFSGTLSGNGAVHKTGTGTWTMSGTNTYAGGTTVDSGTLIFASAAVRPAGDILMINKGASAPSVVIIGAEAANADAYRQAIATSYAGGTWTNGGTIGSPDAQANPGQGIGLITGSDFNALHGDGLLADDALMLKYTWAGDADMDGLITQDDYLRIDAAFLDGTATGWANGDFNYDGMIDATDYALIDFGFENQSGPLAEGMISLHAAELGQPYVQALTALEGVPEPASAALLMMGTAGLLLRRRR